MIIKPSTPPLVGSKVNLLHPLARGLVGYWPLNEGAGSRVNDATNQDNRGLFTGTIPFPNWVGSPIGTAINNTGASYALIPYHNSLALSGAFTVMGFVNVTTMPASGQLMAFMSGAYVSADNTVPFCFEIHNNAGTTRLRYYVGTAVVFTWDFTATTFPAGVWHHVAMMSNGVTGYIIVNGVAVASAASTGAVLAANHNWAIGSLVIDGVAGRLLNGVQAHWGVWRRGLSLLEINQHRSNPNQLFVKQPIWYTLTNATVDQTIAGIYRTQTTEDATIAGIYSVLVATDRTIAGVYNVTDIVDQTIAGVYAVVDTTDQTISGVYNVIETTDQTIAGIYTVNATTNQTIAGVYRSQDTLDQTIAGVYRVHTGINWLALRLRKNLTESITAEDNDYNFNLLQLWTDEVKVEVELLQTSAGPFLLKASNLSDVASAATSFNNIKQAATLTATGVRLLPSYFMQNHTTSSIGAMGDVGSWTLVEWSSSPTYRSSSDWTGYYDATGGITRRGAQYGGATTKWHRLTVTGMIRFDDTAVAGVERIGVAIYKNPTITDDSGKYILNTGTVTRCVAYGSTETVATSEYLYYNFAMQDYISVATSDFFLVFFTNLDSTKELVMENIMMHFEEFPTT